MSKRAPRCTCDVTEDPTCPACQVYSAAPVRPPEAREMTEVDDLAMCREILAADMTLRPEDAPLPAPAILIPLGTVAFALYAAIQELREWRRVSRPSVAEKEKE